MWLTISFTISYPLLFLLIGTFSIIAYVHNAQQCLRDVYQPGWQQLALNWRHLVVNDETKIATTASAVHARVFMAVWVRNSWTWLVGSSHIHNFYTKLLNKKWYPKINRPMSPCRQSESSVQSCRQIRSVVLTWKRAKNCRKFRAKRVPPIGSTQKVIATSRFRHKQKT